MSVEMLGRDLLGEVKVEGLDELLRSLRQRDATSPSPLGFLPLDRLLNIFQVPTPPQQQNYQTQWSAQHERPIPPRREKLLPVIEIIGAAACSGKSQLLHHLISLSLLPTEHKDVPINGKGNAVILLDLSGRLSVLRLQQMMHHQISSSCSASSLVLPKEEISSLVSEAFTHLHIFHPQSSSSLLATLDSMPAFLLASSPTHLSANRPFGLLAIMDLSAFLWQDRLDADEDTGLPPSNYAEKANNTGFLERYRSLISSLRQIQRLFSCTVVATNWGLAPVASVAGHLALRPHLPSSWNNFCVIKVVVEKERVSKFGPGLSADEAKTEGVQRWNAVEKSGFLGWVNWWGSEGWEEEVKEGVMGLKDGGGFSFKVTEDSVDVKSDLD